jgi:predicted acetyltransferase
MSLQQAEWHDILRVLHETVHIWSSGLSSLDYRRLLTLQMQTPWFRRNCRFMIYKNHGVLRSSCKLYTFEFFAHGRTYRLAGLGAIYTQLDSRGNGYASELINEVLDFCEEQNFDGVVLYSEIGTDFYADFGFEEFGSVDFHIASSSLVSPEFLPELSPKLPRELPRDLPPDLTSERVSKCGLEHRVLENSRNLGASSLNMSDIPFLQRHYSRWLRLQPFGMKRNESYWQYKLSKENFLHENSRTGWNALSLLKVDVDRTCEGYAIVVINADSIRILEIVGSESARNQIWANLLTQILKGSINRVDGWEAVIRDLSPTYKVRSLGLENHLLAANLEVFCTQREWGQGMILCLNPDLQNWLSVNPCPMLELDHL